MSDFKVIETQEELDKIIGSAKAKAKESVQKDLDKVEAEKSELTKQVEELQKELDGKNQAFTEMTEKAKRHDEEVQSLQAQLKDYETKSLKTRIAHEQGLPFESIDYLKGDNAEDITASAEAFKKIVAHNQPAPVAQLEPQKEENNTRAGYAQLVRGINKED